MPRSVTRLLSALLLALGVAMLIVTVAGGGGPLASGVILGLLFTAAGALRLYASSRSAR